MTEISREEDNGGGGKIPKKEHKKLNDKNLLMITEALSN